MSSPPVSKQTPLPTSVTFSHACAGGGAAAANSNRPVRKKKRGTRCKTDKHEYDAAYCPLRPAMPGVKTNSPSWVEFSSPSFQAVCEFGLPDPSETKTKPPTRGARWICKPNGRHGLLLVGELFTGRAAICHTPDIEQPKSRETTSHHADCERCARTGTAGMPTT